MEAQLVEKGIRVQSLFTTGPMDLYVNAATGNDLTGDGTIGLPYETIPRAYSDVPKNRRHLVHLHIAAGAYTAWPELITGDDEDDGSLSFDGTAAMVDVAAGPYTIDVGAPVQLGDSYAFDFPVTGGGLTPGAWDGLFVEMLDGAAVGNIFPILTTEAANLRVQGAYIMPGAGDTFKVIEPGVEVVAPNACVIEGTATGEGQNVLAICGIKLTATNGITCTARSVVMTGSIFDPDEFTSYNTMLTGGYAGAMTSFIDVPSYVSNWSGFFVFTNSGTSSATIREDASINNAAIFRTIDFWGGNFSMSLSSIKSASYGIDAFSRIASALVQLSYFEVLITKEAVSVANAGFFGLSAVYVEKGLTALRMNPGCVGRISGLTGDDANVTNALIIGQGSRLSMEVSFCSLVGATGAGNAIKWSSGAANSAYPAANTEVNDTHGAQVAGY